MKKKIDYRFYIALGIIALALVLSLIFGFSAYVRTWESIKYLGRSLGVLFTFSDQLVVPLPPNLNLDVLKGTTLPADFTELTYWFKTFSIAFLNRDIAINYLYNCLVFLVACLQYGIWIPLLILIFVLAKLIILSKRPPEVKGNNKSLVAFKHFEQKVIAPIKNWITAFFDYWRKHKAFSISIIVIIALTYRGGAIAIDLIAFYFVFCKTFNFASALGLIVSVIIDVIAMFYTSNKFFMSIIAIFIFFWLRKKSGRDYLKRMQVYNEHIAANLAIVTMISGAIGSGKTMMVTSLGQDCEKLTRNKLFNIIKKYTLMFPNFPWDNFESFIRNRATIKGKRKLVNRAQIGAEITRLFESFLNHWNADKQPYFFGYDYESYGLTYWNGIQQISLLDALVAYGQAFFLYDVNKPLSASNYSIRFDFVRKGYFPLYKYDYYKRDKKERWATWNEYFASIMNMDYHRITNHRSLDPNDYHMFDGGVETITEIDKERLNNPEQQGLEKKSEEANQKNDGWNKDYKIARHKHMIDNEVIFNSIVDTQREASVNLDFVETCEDHMRVLTRSETKMTLPFFDFDYLFCAPIIKLFNDFYFEYRSLRNDNSLFNYILMKLTTLANNHLERLISEFSYQEQTFRKEIGKTAEESGERYRQSYYLISQKIFGSYRTDCYAAFFNEQKMDALKGFYDAPTFASTLATPEELDKLLSYWIDELKKHASKSTSASISKKGSITIFKD